MKTGDMKTQLILHISPLLLIGALAGCALGPDYKKPEVNIPSAYKEAQIYAGWKVSEPRDDQPRENWWEAYGDSQLNSLIHDALVANQDIQLAEARYRQAQALAQSSRAALFPVLGANASSTRAKRSGTVSSSPGAGRIIDTHNLSLAASWEVDLWGRIRRQVESGDAGSQATAADLEVAKLSVAAATAQHYFQLRILDTLQKLLDDTSAAFERSLQLTRNRYAVGVASRADVTQSETQFKSTQSLATDNRLKRAQLEHAIATLLGKTPAELSIPASPYVEADGDRFLNISLPGTPPSLPSELLERRPDVAAAERRVAAANASIGVAQAAFFPSLSIGASGGYQSSALSDLVSTPSRIWSIGPLIAASIFDGGLRRAQTDAAIADYDANVAIYRQTVLNAFQEVEDNLAALGLLEEQSGQQQEAVRFARESVQQTLNRYKAGTVDYLSVVTVQTTALSNERSALEVEARRLTASIELVKALGGGWSGMPDSRTVSVE